MSKLTGMQIFALLSDVKDGLILESAAPLITAGATAAGTAGTIVLGDTTATASTAAKAGFGAWVAKGGWVALVAAGVAAVGVAVGAFFLGNGGDVPSVGTGDVTIEGTEETSDESTDGTETPTTEEPAEVSRYFQFPLRSSNDTTSYVSIPDMINEPSGPIEFFVLPSDTDTPELTSAYKLYISKDFPMNIQLIAFKSEKFYGILYVMEKAQPDTQGLLAGDGTVGLECYSIYFDGTESGGYYSIYADYDPAKGCHYFEYTEGKKVSVTAYKTYQWYLRKAEKFIDNYSDSSQYEYTILYSYIDGVETINQPAESIPEFSFAIFNAYIEPDLG